MSNTFPSVIWFLIQAFEVWLGAGGNISIFRYWTRTQLHFDEVEKLSTKTPSIIKTVLRKYGWVMGKNFIVVNVTFFLKFVCVLLWPVEWLFRKTFSSSPTHLTTNDTRDGTWISTEGYRPFKCESFTKTLRLMFCRLLALFGIYIYIFVATDNSRLQHRPQGAFPWLWN